MLLLMINSEKFNCEKFNCEKISFVIARCLIAYMQYVVVIYYILRVLCPSIRLKDKVLTAQSLFSEQIAGNHSRSLYPKCRQMN